MESRLEALDQYPQRHQHQGNATDPGHHAPHQVDAVVTDPVAQVIHDQLEEDEIADRLDTHSVAQQILQSA